MAKKKTPKKEKAKKQPTPERVKKQKIPVHERQTKIIILALIAVIIIFFVTVKYARTPSFTQDETGKSKSFLGLFDKGTNHYFYNSFEVRKIKDSEQSFHYETLIHLNGQLAILKTKYGPKEVEDITITPEVSQKILESKKLWITFEDKESTALSVVAEIEIEKFTDNPYLWDISTDAAFVEPYKNMTVITCDNVTDITSVIHMKPSSETKIYDSNGCIIIEAATERDFIRAADRLGFTLTNVMKSNQ